MALWGKTDAASAAPKFRVDGAAANVAANTMFENVTSGAFKTNLVIGVYGVDNAEASVSHKVSPGWVAVRRGTGAVSAISGANNGGTGYGNLAVGALSGGGTDATFRVASTNSTGGVTGITLLTAGAGFPNTSGLTLVQPANGIYAVTVGGGTAGGSGYDNTDIVTFSNGSVNASATVATNATGGITAATITSGGRGFTNTLNTVVTIKNAAGAASNGSTANLIPTIATGSSLTLTGLITLNGRAGRVQYEQLVALGSMTSDSDDVFFPDS